MSGHTPSWIHVGESECEECGGVGVERHSQYLIRYDGVESLKRQGYGCRSCDGTGKRSVGYVDLRDASGR